MQLTDPKTRLAKALILKGRRAFTEYSNVAQYKLSDVKSA